MGTGLGVKVGEELAVPEGQGKFSRWRSPVKMVGVGTGLPSLFHCLCGIFMPKFGVCTECSS